MRKSLVLTAVAVVVGLLITSGGGLIADTLYPATVTFTDRAGDNITSDYLTTGSQTYTNIIGAVYSNITVKVEGSSPASAAPTKN